MGKYCIKAIGYADDVLLVGQGGDPKYLVSEMQRAINLACAWANQSGLAYNPQKTECCFVHPGYKVYQTPRLKIGNTPLAWSDKIQYLGLDIDKKLLWNDHLEGKCLRAKRLLQTTKRAVGREWGLTPEKIMWIHKAIVRPQITYGSLVWAHRIKLHHRTKLDSVQRMALVSVFQPMRSTPTAGMEAILGVQPLHLHCQETALNAAYRLHLVQGWGNQNDKGSHRDFHLLDLKVILPKGNRPPPAVFKVNRITKNQSLEGHALEVFSDGSKDGNRTGYGWCITLGDEVLHEQSRPLDPYSSVFMAEMIAIIDSLTKLEDWLEGTENQGATVWTDSRSSIDAIYTPIITQALALEANNIIQRLQEKGHPISLRWIQATGNCTFQRQILRERKSWNLMGTKCSG